MENKIELMDMAIEQVKQLAKPNDKPMLYFKNKDGKLILTLLADGIQEDKKYMTCLAIKALKEISQCKEMVMVTEAWMANQNKENPDLEPSKDPNRKECFAITYFSEDKCLMNMLEFGRTESGKIVWKDEIKYDLTEKGKCESRFNPFKFKDEDVKGWLEQMEQDEMVEKGKKEKIKLPFNFEMVIYRHKGKGFIQIFNAQKKPFLSIKPANDDEKFKKLVEESTELLNYLGQERWRKFKNLWKK